MRKPIVIITIFFTLIYGCQSELDKNIEFDVLLKSPSGVWNQDTLVVKKSEAVQFDFIGNSEFISLYTGESGSEYKMKDVTEHSLENIADIQLKFSTTSRYQDIPNTLKIFLSDSFTGLNGVDKRVDSLLVESNEWIDITTLAKFPTVRAGSTSTTISLTEYKDKQLSFAFFYETNRNDVLQPQWTISNMEIVVTLTSGKSSTVKAVALGFIPLDMYSLENPYASLVESGRWDISNIAAAGTAASVIIRSSQINAPINKDWLISTPAKLNRRMPDKAIGIKSITDEMSSYEYTYSDTGLYTATFIASRINQKNTFETIREFYIKVVD